MPTITMNLEQRADEATANGDLVEAEILYTDAIEQHQKTHRLARMQEIAALYSKLAAVMEALGKDASAVRRIAAIMDETNQ